jgi:type II secretory pathway pseudopilin PulG
MRRHVPADDRQPDRYEPMPGIFDLPGWLWQRTPRPARVALVVAIVALIVVAIVIGPNIRESKQERERAEQQQRLDARRAREARIRREQRPRYANGPAASSGVPARRRLVEAASASVLADARRRAAAGQLSGPIEGVECEPFPRNVAQVGAEERTTQRFGRYYCLAVTAKFDETDSTSGGLLGHPYRARIDFDSGRYAFCKIAGRPAEGQLRRRLGVTVPAVCGGGP